MGMCSDIDSCVRKKDIKQVTDNVTFSPESGGSGKTMRPTTDSRMSGIMVVIKK